MNLNKKSAAIFEDVKINVKVKLSALWVAVLFCYLYGDLVQLYVPGWIQNMIAGNMGPLGPTTQVKMLGGAVFVTIPAAMIFLSLTLKPKANRWANIIIAILYTLLLLFTMFNAGWYYYIFLGIVEITFKALIIWYAWTWPKQKTNNI